MVQMAEQSSISTEIGASALAVWSMISDVTRMGEWSPENDGAVWLRGATGPTQGATFRGRNHIGKKRWSTVCTVVEAEPGQIFSFRVAAGPFRVAEWRFSFESLEGGCRVTETWIDRRGAVVRLYGRAWLGVSDRVEHNLATMEQTLRRLKTAAEAGTPT